MKPGVISFSSALILAICAAPLAAWADANPDFDDDAKPILRMQPGLLEYVQSRFQVKDTGTAKYPGDDDRPPRPPFIFRARPVGSYILRLLIQPGGPGHILGVVDMTKVHLTAPTSPSGQGPQVPQGPAASQTPPPPSDTAPESQPPAPEDQTPPPSSPTANSSQPSGPTADTPSGPIMDSGSQAPSSNPPSLAPPPDPAPATH
jgi:hypothetical protein